MIIVDATAAAAGAGAARVLPAALMAVFHVDADELKQRSCQVDFHTCKMHGRGTVRERAGILRLTIQYFMYRQVRNKLDPLTEPSSAI